MFFFCNFNFKTNLLLKSHKTRFADSDLHFFSFVLSYSFIIGHHIDHQSLIHFPLKYTNGDPPPMIKRRLRISLLVLKKYVIDNWWFCHTMQCILGCILLWIYRFMLTKDSLNQCDDSLALFMFPIMQFYLKIGNQKCAWVLSIFVKVNILGNNIDFS